MIKRLLVGLGGTPYAASKIRCAVELAERFNLEVTGVTVFDDSEVDFVGPVPVGGGASAADLREHRARQVGDALEEAIDRCRSACDERNIRCHIIREHGDPFEQLLALWRYHDLTVLGLRGMFEYGVLDKVKQAVTRLLASGVRPVIAAGTSYHAASRALIAYNGSLESAKAMKQFAQLGLWPDVAVEIVTFSDSPDEAAQLLHDARDYCAAYGIDAETHAKTGDPRHRLIPFAQEREADIVVMGSTNRGRIAKLVLGDTVETMMRDADMALFLSQ